MKTEFELNREYAKQLSELILQNPDMRVITWINSEGISDEYSSFAGNLSEPCIQTIAYSEEREHWIEMDGNDFEDCCNYYGYVAESWSDVELEVFANKIPWERVIAVNVGVA